MKRPILALATTLSIDNNEEGITPIPPKRRRLSISSNWIVNELPEMPYLYLKEKTSVVVLNDSPQNIANRIVESAKGMHCIGEYDTANAKATLSVDNTEFCIQLFKVRVTEKKNECIIVEMFRISGSSIVFHTAARTLLSASKQISASSNNMTCPFRSPGNSPRSITCSREGSSEKVKESDLFACTMEIIDSLLKKDRIDANLLGMESLQLLTSTRSSSDAMVAYASNVVTNGCAFMNVKDTVFSLIFNKGTDEIEGANDVEDKYHRKMRACALTTLSNALSVISSDESFQEFSQEDEWSRDDDLLAVLLKELDKANTCPHEGHLAAKSLITMMENSTKIRTAAIGLNGPSSVMKMKDALIVYPLLKGVSDTLLQILGETK